MPDASGPWQTAQRAANTAAPETGSSAAAGSTAAATPKPNNTVDADRAVNVLLLINRDTQDDGGGAGIGLALGPETPGDFVVVLRPHDRPISLIVLAGTPPPGHAAAAVIVRNDVVSLVRRIAAGADPRDRRHLRAGRTGIHAAAVTGTQRSVDGAVTPVVALGRIAGVLRVARALRSGLSRIRIRRRIAGLLLRASGHGQQGQRSRSGEK